MPYARLPASGSEIVLFDVNRTVLFGPLMRTTSYTAVERLLPPLPQDSRITIASNAGVDDPATIERRIEAGAWGRIRSESRCGHGPRRTRRADHESRIAVRG
ncbi:MAG: hypothetical protein NDI84_07025 [Steroidobacteraceae bacterium]|nr:hypothetical protein [Steroidobacteraceae bacterium]